MESTPDVGSTFRFTIPLQRGVPATRQESTTPRAGESRRRVLIVDDSASSRSMLERQLCQWGWRATALDRPAVATATLAAAAAAGDPYDVALIDATMPDGDGIQVAKSLRDATVQPPA